MRILGIDPALSVTGYGVIDSRQRRFVLVEAGIVKTDPVQKPQLRLQKIHKALTQLVRQTRPEVMVLEKLYAHYRHPTTAYLLGQARGVICLVCAQEGIALVEYSATRVKKAVTGHGLASKEQVQRMVATVLGLSSLPRYMDVTDALALAIAHSYIKTAKTDI